MLSGLPLNPAFTGTRGALNATISHRSQWIGFGDALYTSTISMHSPSKSEKLGIGGYVFTDVIGVSKQTGVMLNAAYQIKLTRENKLSFGLAGGIIMKQDKWSDILTTDQQDQVFEVNQTGYTPNISTGIYYYTKDFYVSLSSPFMFTPKFNGSTISADISPKGYNVFLNSGKEFKIDNKFKITPSFMLKYIYASPLQTDVNLMTKYSIKRVSSVHAGLSWRRKEAMIGIVKFELKVPYHIVFGYAFDYTLNAINIHSKGSHEISIQFDLKKTHNNYNPRFF